MNDTETVNLNNLTQEKINSFVCKLGNFLLDSAKSTFGTHIVKPKRKQKNSREHKPWFNLECKFARQNYRKLIRKHKEKLSLSLGKNVKETDKNFWNF